MNTPLRLTPAEARTLQQLVARSDRDRKAADDTRTLCRWLVACDVPEDEKHALLDTFRGGY